MVDMVNRIRFVWIFVVYIPHSGFRMATCKQTKWLQMGLVGPMSHIDLSWKLGTLRLGHFLYALATLKPRHAGWLVGWSTRWLLCCLRVLVVEYGRIHHFLQGCLHKVKSRGFLLDFCLAYWLSWCHLLTCLLILLGLDGYSWALTFTDGLTLKNSWLSILKTRHIEYGRVLPTKIIEHVQHCSWFDLAFSFP